MRNNGKIIGAGLLTAISASLCCITPILALLAGTSGMASTFSWIEPFRPYLIGLTILVLSFAWYQILQPKKDMNCDCDADEQTNLLQSKSFLGVVTVFALVMLVFPYFSSIFYLSNVEHITTVEQSKIEKIEINISGMTCNSCEEHIDHEVGKIDGILNSQASYEKGNAVVEFDKTKTNWAEIQTAINSTGYEVVNKLDN
ncbi:MAG: mercuric transport protein MerTP [Salibacteraceae bacterium]|nr:mercuric transport protein MerTP [Salibacteraceae bacterium]|tara:strand:+ start:20833 stop:21432 length:600 start_codon:yes stop_codon:yes gene_type:complete